MYLLHELFVTDLNIIKEMKMSCISVFHQLYSTHAYTVENV